MSLCSFIAAIFTGCGKQVDHGILPSEQKQRPFSQITPVSFPEGVELTGLYMTHQGMRGGNYYILASTDAGTFMKISDCRPDAYVMVKDEDQKALPSNAEYLGFADTVKDCEYASLVHLKEDKPLQELKKAIEESGALAWDGYDEKDPMEGVLDSGDSYQLYLELSDGSTVTMDGYNVCPAGFLPLFQKVRKVFEDNSDYSRYLATDFETSPCVRLYVLFRDGWSTEYRLELSGERWIVVLNDPDGEILNAGTEITDYGDLANGLPFERFLDVLKQHKAEKWNGYHRTGEKADGSFTIRLLFEDGKKYESSGNVYFEGFEEYKEDLVNEMYCFYNEVKGTE